MLHSQLIYIGDPMCSWCWGIAPELDKLLDDYQENLGFRLVLGGLRPGGGDAWTPQFRNFLREHWEHVQEASGQDFNFDLLEREAFNYDTEPPCRAVRVIRDLAPEQEFAFFKAVQRQFYVENGDPDTPEFYESLCEEHQINFGEFRSHFASDLYRQRVREDFAQNQEWGIMGFPSVLLQRADRLYAVTLGYSSYSKMRARLDSFLNNPPEQ